MFPSRTEWLTGSTCGPASLAQASRPRRTEASNRMHSGGSSASARCQVDVIPLLRSTLVCSALRVLGGEDGRLGAPLEPELGEHRGDVVLHRLLGEVHLGGDLAVGHPFADQLQDPALLRGQRRECRVLLGSAAEPVEDLLGHRGVQGRLPGGRGGGGGGAGWATGGSGADGRGPPRRTVLRRSLPRTCLST